MGGVPERRLGYDLQPARGGERNRCTAIPSDTNPDAAALFGCAVTTGFGVVENNAKLKDGRSRRRVWGRRYWLFCSGGDVSAGPIIAVDRFDSRLRFAEQMGATHCINSSSSDPEQAIKQALGRQMLDVFIDNTGVPAIIELGYDLTHKAKVALCS